VAQAGTIRADAPVNTTVSVKVLQAVEGGLLTVPGESWLLQADFFPQGPDLLLTGPDGAQVLIRDFYNLENPPGLTTDAGGVISADLAIKLAGPMATGQLALVQDSPFSELAQVAESIGRVEATDGLVEAIRVDGTKVALSKGDDIFQGDTLVTGKGAAIGITFVDDTTFSLGEEGRMVIDEMVYDAGAQEGTFNANLVQGVFSFVSGKIAKTSPDGMTVTTPVATIGIRGTKVAGRAAQEGAENTISLLPELDPQGNQIVGELAVTNQGGTVTLNAIGATVQMTSAFQPPPPPVTFSPEQIQQNFGGALTTLSTAAAEKANNDATQNAQEAEQAGAEAEVAGAEAEAAAAEAEAAAAEAEAAQAEAEASGDPDAIAAAEAAAAEAEAKAAEAETKAAEAETAAQEAEVAQAEAETAQAQAEQANNELQAQAEAFASFGGPAPGGDGPPDGQAQPQDGPQDGPQTSEGDVPPGGNSPPEGEQQAVGGEPLPEGGTFDGEGGDIFLGGGDPFSSGGDLFSGGGDILFGGNDPLGGGDEPLLGGSGEDPFVGDPLAGGNDPLIIGYDPLLGAPDDGPPETETDPYVPPVQPPIDPPGDGNSNPALTITPNQYAAGGSSTSISPAHLNATDAEDPASALIYTLDSLASYGDLKLSGTLLNIGDTFTQADVDMNLVTYVHDGTATSADAFDFTLSDSDGGTSPSITFDFFVAIGGTFTNDAGVDMGMIVNIAPTTLINDGTLNVAAASTITTPTTITNNATMNVTSGITAPTTLDNTASGTINIDADSVGTKLQSTTAATNDGVVNIDASIAGASTIYYGSSGSTTNTGTINVLNTGNTFEARFAGTFDNTGVVSFDNNGNFEGQLTNQNGGIIDIASGVLLQGAYNHDPIMNAGSVLQGGGTFQTAQNGTYTYNGTWNPGTDGTIDTLTMAFQGHAAYNRYLNMSTSTVLNIDVDTGTSDTLAFTATSNNAGVINGTLNLKSINGYTASAGDTFTVFTYDTGTTGTFTISDDFGAGWYVAPTYSATSLTLTVLSESVVSGVTTLTGTSGDDTISLPASSATTIDLAGGTADTLNLANGGNTVTVTNTETVTGGTGNDVITATGTTAQTLNGGTGADSFYLAGATAGQTIRYTTSSDGATTAGSLAGRDTIYGFTHGSDSIGIAGSLASQIDDFGTADGVITWAAVNGIADFSTGTHEALLISDGSATTNFADFLTTQSGAPTIIANIINSIGISTVTGGDGLVVFSETNAAVGGGAGVFFFEENGITVNNVTADELTYIATIDSTTATTTSDFAIVS
jgi:hypothetical protein